MTRQNTSSEFDVTSILDLYPSHFKRDLRPKDCAEFLVLFWSAESAYPVRHWFRDWSYAQEWAENLLTTPGDHYEIIGLTRVQKKT
jgi:hypothetical protein